MIIEDLCCWRCGGSLSDVLQPIARAAECPHCTVDLHVCRLCLFFDKDARLGCKEPIADEVNDKERSNFCGYFQPVLRVDSPGGSADVRSAAALESLFGLDPESTVNAPTSAAGAKSELEKLFDLQASANESAEPLLQPSSTPSDRNAT